jgi:acetyltransferase-like isoleucine patch superfamily enzyme
MIHPTAEVSPEARVGKNVKIWHYVQIREGAVIGDNSSLGKSVYIDKNVKIGSNVKIQNRASIYDGVTIEDDCFIGPHVVFTNDKTPRAFGEWKIIKTLVKKGASIGANSTIICGVTLGEYCMVGAGSVVTENVPAHALVYGNPAKLKGFVCFCGKSLKMIKEIEDSVLMKCESCGKEIKIPFSDYKKCALQDL